ncbi:MAG: hypothetical protein H5T86_12395, partial [Armatimonadetes bacterium]|nr:hypothetical protein [Armatimonadota bacterium]
MAWADKYAATGAGTPEVNGLYTRASGTWNGYDYYEHAAGDVTYYMFVAAGDGDSYWEIATSLFENHSDPVVRLYFAYCDGPPAAPDQVTWEAAAGHPPAPTVTAAEHVFDLFEYHTYRRDGRLNFDSLNNPFMSVPGQVRWRIAATGSVEGFKVQHLLNGSVVQQTDARANTTVVEKMWYCDQFAEGNNTLQLRLYDPATGETKAQTETYNIEAVNPVYDIAAISGRAVLRGGVAPDGPPQVDLIELYGRLAASGRVPYYACYGQELPISDVTAASLHVYFWGRVHSTDQPGWVSYRVYAPGRYRDAIYVYCVWGTDVSGGPCSFWQEEVPWRSGDCEATRDDTITAGFAAGPGSPSSQPAAYPVPEGEWLAYDDGHYEADLQAKLEMRARDGTLLDSQEFTVRLVWYPAASDNPAPPEPSEPLGCHFVDVAGQGQYVYVAVSGGVPGYAVAVQVSGPDTMDLGQQSSPDWTGYYKFGPIDWSAHPDGYYWFEATVVDSAGNSCN